MTRLSLRDESAAVGWQVWPNAESVPSGQICETGSYLFELEGDFSLREAVLLVDEVALEGLRPSGAAVARWRWSPGFHAGTVEAELRLPGLVPQQFEIVTDPDQRKLNREDFDSMVREILDDTFALFALSSFRKGIGKGTGHSPPPIARLEFLRSRIVELEAVAAEIARAPRRNLAATDAVLPYYRAVRATGPEIIRSLRSGRQLRETGNGPSRLPAALQGFLPERIHVRHRTSTLDLPEHRQMAACLRSWAGWLANTAGILNRSGSQEDTEMRRSQRLWADRCRRLSRRVGALSLLPPFMEAGDASACLIPSSIFRRDPVYRRFFRLWQDINLGIAAVFGDFLNMPLARTFELYELWCFLRLVRAGTEAWGPTGLEVSDMFITNSAGAVTIASGAVTVPVGSGWKLCFQKQYQEFWKEPDGRGSFSRVMIPDVVMIRDQATAEDEPSRLIVLDAKYRVENGLGDALNSIHTYRDALVRETEYGVPQGIVTAAYFLAPYLAEEAKGGYRHAPLPGRLFHPEYRQAFRFGAVTLRPGMSVKAVSDALKAIVSDATVP